MASGGLRKKRNFKGLNLPTSPSSEDDYPSTSSSSPYYAPYHFYASTSTPAYHVKDLHERCPHYVLILDSQYQ